MFGSNYMIPPQGGDRRGPIVTRGGKGQFLLDRFSLWGIEGADFPYLVTFFIFQFPYLPIFSSIDLQVILSISI
jgi:hypothetical protein